MADLLEMAKQLGRELQKDERYLAFRKASADNDADEALQKEVIGGAKRVVVAEAGCRMGWEGYAKKSDLFTLNDFGESGPAAKVAEHLGFTADKFAELLAK